MPHKQFDNCSGEEQPPAAPPRIHLSTIPARSLTTPNTLHTSSQPQPQPPTPAKHLTTAFSISFSPPETLPHRPKAEITQRHVLKKPKLHLQHDLTYARADAKGGRK